MKRRKESGKKFILLLTALGLLAANIQVVHADDVYRTEVSIDVQQAFAVRNPVKGAQVEDTFNYRLTPVSADAPLPQGHETDYEFSVEGNDQIALEPIVYEHPGIYTYRMSEDVDEQEKGYTYDPSVYRVDVYVENATDGTLDAQITAQKDGVSGKSDSILYANAWTGPEVIPSDTPEPTETPEPSDTPTPSETPEASVTPTRAPRATGLPTPRVSETPKATTIRTTTVQTSVATAKKIPAAAGKATGAKAVDTADHSNSPIFCIAIGLSAAGAILLISLRQNRKHHA